MKIYYLLLVVFFVEFESFPQEKLNNEKGELIMKKIIVEIQYFNGCPNSFELIKRVKEVIAELNNEFTYREIIVETNEEAKKVNFRGSPTLLINGIDFEEISEPINPYLSCRFYNNGLPSITEIRQKISALL